MRNAKKCGCSFSQDRDASSCVGERIRVNQSCNRCDQNDRGRDARCECQNSSRPRPCPSPCPSCEDRCASQFRNCMRNCRWDDNCDCKGHRPNCDFDKDNQDCDCRGQRPCHDKECDRCDFDHEDK